MSSNRLYRYASILVWIAFLGGLTFVFAWLLEQQQNPNQTVITQTSDSGALEVVLEANRQGHYVANGMINGETVVLLLDTGATDVSVPAGLALKLDLQRGAPMLANTANGTIEVYATRLKSVRLGEIELRNVPASINPGMQGEEVLLGMSFLRHLELNQRNRTLRLSVPQN